MDALLFTVISTVIFLIIFIISNGYYSNIMFKEIKIFAENEGLVFNEVKGLFGISDETTVTGNYKGFNFKLCRQAEKHSDHTSDYIIMKLPFSAYYNFYIEAEDTSFLNSNIYIIDDIFVKREDFSTGDREFDRNFKLHRDVPDYICDILTPDIRREMLKNKILISQIVFYNHEIQYRINSNFKVQELKYASEFLYKLVENLSQRKANR